MKYEYCCKCDCATGKAGVGEDSLYTETDGPFCENCFPEFKSKQEQDEPVAMRYDFDGYGYKYIDSGSGSDWQTRERGAEPLYTKPQTKEWADLSVDDIEDIAEQFHDIDYDINENPYDIFDHMGYALALQAKLKEKNS